MTFTKNTFIFITFLFISACGYHLRSQADLPKGLDKVYLQGASSEFRKIMKTRLKSSGVKLVDKLEQAGLIVQVEKEKMDRRVLSLSSTGRANEYELYFLLDFILLDAKGNVLAKKQNIEITRDYFNDQEAVLGKNNEELVIREEIYNRAVETIITRAVAVLTKK
jgi:LPS-assembly lipoprotein